MLTILTRAKIFGVLLWGLSGCFVTEDFTAGSTEVDASYGSGSDIGVILDAARADIGSTDAGVTMDAMLALDAGLHICPSAPKTTDNLYLVIDTACLPQTNAIDAEKYYTVWHRKLRPLLVPLSQEKKVFLPSPKILAHILRVVSGSESVRLILARN